MQFIKLMQANTRDDCPVHVNCAAIVAIGPHEDNETKLQLLDDRSLTVRETPDAIIALIR